MIDTTEIRRAYADFLAVAEAGGFGRPRPREWDAVRILAHVYSGHNQIAACALRVAAGERPAYDNRPSLDEWNLGRIVSGAGDLPGMISLVRRQGELFCTVAEQLSDADLDVLVPVLIISNDEMIVDEPWPVRQLVLGVAAVHLPRHADQLRSLVAVSA